MILLLWWPVTQGGNMTQHNVNCPQGGTGRFQSALAMQRQYWALWLKSRLRRTRLPQTFMMLAGMMLSALVLCIIMVTIVIFDLVLLLVSAMQTPFRGKKNLHFPTVRTH